PKATTKVITGRDRIFNKAWLASKYATFELVSVVNRIDRKDFGSGACGETRFVYRLSYVKGKSSVPTFSRLPFFFNVVYENLEQDCAKRVGAWTVPEGQSADTYAAWLEQGALDRNALALKQLELNAQVIRVPSESKTELGGLARYFLRVYKLINHA